MGSGYEDPFSLDERAQHSLDQSQWAPSREFDLPLEGNRPEITQIDEQSENSCQGRLNGRQLFMAKPVFPVIYRNPISEAEDREEHYPDLELHPRMEEFIDNGARSQDLGFLEEKIEAADFLEDEDRRCEICGRSLLEKSPWNSFRINEATIAAVLPCGDIFHAECLEETTPWTRTRDPPCPICEEGFVFSRPLEEALRCARRHRRNGGAAMAVPQISGGRGRYGSLLKDSFKRGCRFSSWQGFWRQNRGPGLRI